MCKHTYAVYEAVNAERLESKTDKEQMWQKPSAANLQLYPKGEPVAKIMYEKSPEKHNFKPSEEATDIMVGLFQKHGVKNASIFKSLTVEKTAVPPTIQKPLLDHEVKNLLALPRLALADVCTAARSPVSSYTHYPV